MSRKILLMAAIPALASFAYWTLRLAWADHLSRKADLQAVVRAVALAAGDADIRLRLAARQQAEGIDPVAALEAATRLDPRNADAWMRLGLAEEMHGDFRHAGSHLLDAARVSRQFAPRWALTNYYFRRGDEEQFWHWARESLLMGYGDLNPIFRLCWNMGQDASMMERILPERNSVLNAYVQYWMQQAKPATAEGAAIGLAAMATPDDQSTLVTWCNRQIDAGSVPATVQVWNTLCTRHLLPYAPLDRNRAPLTDGDFAALSTNGGFAWRLPETSGVTSGRNRTTAYLWVAFSGDQPETCAPLVQFIPTAPGATYKVRYEYRTAGLPSVSGLRWTVFDASTGAGLAVSSWLAAADWRREEMSFSAPASGMVRLSLTCQRVPGATRLEGSLNLRRLSLNESQGEYRRTAP